MKNENDLYKCVSECINEKPKEMSKCGDNIIIIVVIEMKSQNQT